MLHMMEAVMFGGEPRDAELLHTRFEPVHVGDQTLRPTESISVKLEPSADCKN